MDKLSVAIADDNENMVRLLSDIVRNDEELQVIGTAKDGEEAYEMIRTKEPDVVLLDIVMPKLDGLGVMDKVNSDKNLKKHPNFIMVSAIGQEKLSLIHILKNWQTAEKSWKPPQKLMRLQEAEGKTLRI